MQFTSTETAEDRAKEFRPKHNFQKESCKSDTKLFMQFNNNHNEFLKNARIPHSHSRSPAVPTALRKFPLQRDRQRLELDIETHKNWRRMLAWTCGPREKNRAKCLQIIILRGIARSLLMCEGVTYHAWNHTREKSLDERQILLAKGNRISTASYPRKPLQHQWPTYTQVYSQT